MYRNCTGLYTVTSVCIHLNLNTCASDYSFTVRRQPLWRETLSDPMNTEHDSTTDITRFPAGNPDTMDDDTLQPESPERLRPEEGVGGSDDVMSSDVSEESDSEGFAG